MSVFDEASVVSAGEPVPVDAATEQEMNAIAEEKLELLGNTLALTRNKWVAARTASGVERRWMEDTDQYLGKDAATKNASDMMDAVANGGYPTKAPDVKAQRSTVFVNITRPKTNAVEARLANMLYPADDLAWGILPTPRPDLVMKALQEAQQMAMSATPAAAPQAGAQQMGNPTPAQVPSVPGGIQPAAGSGAAPAQSTAVAGNIQQNIPKTETQLIIDQAKAKAKGMEGEINDALVECDFNAEGRKLLHDVAVLGSGVLKGPIVVNRVAKVWQEVPGGQPGVHQLKIVKQIKPASEAVSPWHIYPDPSCGTNIHHGKGIFEKRNLTGKMLRELVDQPGYLEHQISKVLGQGPKRATVENERDRRDKESTNEPMYECWEYWGEFTPEDLRACGVDVDDSQTKVVSGCIIMVNDTVIKGFMNPLECGSMPYDIMVLEKADNSPWGFGVPFLCRPAQRVLNAAWRQMMDNAGLSVGPNVVLKPNIIQPADKNWTITGRKIWNCMDESVDVRTAFHLFEIPNNSEEFQKIIELALRFADEETSVPKIAQGEAQGAPDSVGGMTIQMNSANVVLGRLVKQYDDMITKPHIRRYYDFFMAYSDKSDIKGDFQVDARGSSVLLVRDQQIQALMQFGQFQQGQLAPLIRWAKWLKEILKAQNLNPAELLKTDSEIEQILNQPPGPTPDQIKSETAIKVAQMRAEASLQTAQAREEGEMAFANTQAQMARDNQITALKTLEMKRDLELLKYANEQKITLEAVKADLAKTSMVEETKRQIATAKLSQEAIESDKARLTPQGAGNA